MKNSVNKNVPRLRFPEFENAPAWNEKRLADFEDLIHGDGNWILSKDISEKGKYSIVQLGNIGFGDFVYKPLKTISEEKFFEIKGKQILKGDLLINRMVDSNLYCCLLKDSGNFVTSVDVCYIRENKQFLNYFLMNLMLTKQSQNKLLSLSSGSGRVRISKRNLFDKFKFFIPTIFEQQKIANCLTSLDDLITAQSQKVDSLKQHKKGLMQQLFPQADANHPKLRFPEFKNSPVWEEKKLGDISKISTGKLDANAMVANGKYRFYTCAKNYYRIDKYAFNTESLLISGNGANVGYIHYYNGKFNAYQRTYVLDKFTKNIRFIKYYLEQKLSKRIKDEKKEGNTPYIVKSTLSEMIIMLPSNKLEQQKIADCLTSLDELIDAQSQKMAALKQHKKGLMQQLFPVAN